MLQVESLSRWSCLSRLRQALSILIAGMLSPLSTYADDWMYTLRPGDDLWSIATTYCGSARFATDIATYNKLTDVTRLRAGERISIPTYLLAFAPSHAQVLEVTGDVRLQPGPRRAATPTMTATASTEVRPGMQIDMGDQLTTGQGSALIQFADLSTIVIQPGSQVLFNKLTAFGPAGMVDTHLRFTYGRGRAQVEPQNQGDRFRIATPEGVAAVRGTRFRVGHSAQSGAERSNTETLEGLVAFERTGASTDVPAGYGVSASAGGVVRETLLPAPDWVDQGTDIAANSTISWSAVSGASSYLLSWATASNPNVPLAVQTSSNTSAEVDLAPGKYVFSVRAVSSNGIEGFDASHTYAVMQQAPTLYAPPNTVAGPTAFEWAHADEDSQFFLTLLGQHWQQPRTIEVQGTAWVEDLEAGDYQWQLRGADSVVSAPQRFRLQPPAPENVSVSQVRKRLHISWRADAGVDRYVLRLIPVGQPGAAPIERALQPGEHSAGVELEVDAFGTYRLEISAVQNGIASTTVQRRFEVLRRPWWLTLLLPLLLV